MSLSITDLNVWIGDAHILRGITLEVPDGQHVGIIGSSGSGKSMLSLAIMGLLPEGARVEGSIRWNGRELVGASERELRSLRGSQITIEGVDDFVVFQRLREIDVLFDGLLRSRYRVARVEGRVSNGWLDCPDFLIERVPAASARRGAGKAG